MSKDGGNLTVQYNLRWSEEMRDKIAAVAKENTRSMNQEIIARLEESFTPNTTQDLLKEAVILTIQAVKDDPSLLNNAKVSITSEPIHPDNSDKSIVKIINKNKKAP